MGRDETGLRNFFELFGYMAPLLLAAIFGTVWALVNYKKSPVSAIIAAIACVVLMLLTCCIPAGYTWLPRMLLQNAGPNVFERLAWIIRGLKISESLCIGLCVAAIVVAAFLARSPGSGKKDKKKRNRDDDEEDDRPSKKRDRDDDDDEGVSEKPMKKKRDDDDD